MKTNVFEMGEVVVTLCADDVGCGHVYMFSPNSNAYAYYGIFNNMSERFVKVAEAIEIAAKYCKRIASDLSNEEAS